MFTVSPEEMKKADMLSDTEYGVRELTLMKNAAKGCADVIIPFISEKDKIVILCGKGNNGGDGYELCTILDGMGYSVCAVNILDTEPTGNASGKVYSDCVKNSSAVLSSDKAYAVLSNATMIVDAIFGTGFGGNIERNSFVGNVIEKANEASAKRIAIDVPSGINAGDGRISDVNFKADITITMAYVKTGLLSYPAREFCGEIKVIDIGYPQPLCREIKSDAIIPDDSFVKNTIPKRKRNSHKGMYGRLLMYCGSRYMTGAAVLAANAALRSGVGLVNIAREPETLSILQSHLTEPIFSPISGNSDNKFNSLLTLSEKATSVLIGCGIGNDTGDADICKNLIKNVKSRIIIDADGINAICGNTNILREANLVPVITPHPLEFARLIGKGTDEVQADRLNLARNFAAEFGCVVVLKGAGTVIASPDGRLAINVCGSPGLAKGGSGDVLAGLIASFSAQGYDAFESAMLGVYLHAKASDILSKEISESGFVPSDLPMTIARLLP